MKIENMRSDMVVRVAHFFHTAALPDEVGRKLKEVQSANACLSAKRLRSTTTSTTTTTVVCVQYRIPVVVAY